MNRWYVRATVEVGGLLFLIGTAILIVTALSSARP